MKIFFGLATLVSVVFADSKSALLSPSFALPVDNYATYIFNSILLASTNPKCPIIYLLLALSTSYV